MSKRAQMLLLSTVILLGATPTFAQIKIAVAGPMTGSSATFGDQMKNGAQAAVDAINEAGGVLGQKLELATMDDACDPKQAVSVASRIVAEDIKLVFGHFCSGSTIPASDIYDEAGVVSITVSSNPKVTERGLKTIFRITGRDDQQGPSAADYVIKNLSGKKIALVHDRSPYGMGLIGEVKRKLDTSRQVIVLRVGVNPGERDYTALITRLKAAGVEVMFFGGYHAEAGLILRQAADQGLKLQLIGGDTISTQELISIAGPAAEGTLFTFGSDPRKDPAAADVLKEMRAKNLEPEGYVLYAYAAVQVFADALKRVGQVDGPAVAKAITANTASTVAGPMGFDAKGDNKQPGFVVYQWKGGKTDYAPGI
ncbi:branched-chain amino acid ABC transporter substrate-binding protein [Microvirga tunisiensis]|uniref:Branched-chain amino acid ABC transporter substrate-binding protein n=1 Tax=Microvirga tunisiensis TaxID=2108360 RepID=A0A5N7MUM2_9HYPH|nr:branched-chain amino acid ABC transporter substrate-binding protein [Microvirga tunisiensis]MPR12756.1 branched-chain amino acid ABC transporter substrate-binding protein [Microvirga tunisiensis]MPR30683.1 branched-chain amino acid ABC transporter substrate-binding protein [Microvirga tunisiensis]